MRPMVSGPDDEGRLIKEPLAVCDIERDAASSVNSSELGMAESVTSIVRVSSTSLVATVRRVGGYRVVLSEFR